MDVIDYLVKPISYERFLKATEKAHSRLTASFKSVKEEFLNIKADQKIHKINPKDILYIEGACEYVIYHLEEGKLMSLESLKNLEANLSNYFIRIHKSYILNKK